MPRTLTSYHIFTYRQIRLPHPSSYLLRTVDNVGAGTGIEGNNMEEDDGTDMEEDDGTDVIEFENVPRKVELGNGDESWILVKKRRRGNADL
jgi:hypothetical protein